MSTTIAFPPPGADHFAVLGLPRAVELPRAQVEEAYVARARQWHPDRFAGQEPRVRRQAMEASAAANEAHAVLRDPVRRAEYLCKLGGVDLDSSDPATGAPSPSQEFLVEMIERREGLAEARQGGDEALEALRESVEAEADAHLEEACQSLVRGDVPAAARALVARRYLARLLAEAEEAEA